jgi:hypothetical protein
VSALRELISERDLSSFGYARQKRPRLRTEDAVNPRHRANENRSDFAATQIAGGKYEDSS